MNYFLTTAVLAGLISMTCGAALVSQKTECKPGMGAEVGRRFAYEFYEKAVGEAGAQENVFLAPTTVVSALAMVLAGARGKTKDQIWKGLMFESASQNFTEADLPCLLSRYGGGIEGISQQEKTGKAAVSNPLALLTASKLFGDRRWDFADSFIEKTESYGGKMEEVDFATAPEEARQYINDWTARVTQDKIQDLFGSEDITPNTALAIVSAIYFKGLWKTEFDPKLTRTRDFMVTPHRAVQAEFMKTSSKFKTAYSRKLDAKLIELPYQKDAYGRYDASMIIVMPNNPESSITALESKLTEDNLAPVVSELFAAYPRRVHVELPKFKIEGDYKLKSMLQSMGMRDMFSMDIADLSAMIANSSADGNLLYVGSAVHKTFIEVDEKGTEATGATGIAIHFRTRPYTFDCNRPFLTIIYEKKSDTILFIGRVADPKAE